MNMVGHQHEGVNGHAMLREDLANAEQKELVVGFRREHRCSVVATLNHVMRLTFDKTPRRSSHSVLLSGPLASGLGSRGFAGCTVQEARQTSGVSRARQTAETRSRAVGVAVSAHFASDCMCNSCNR
jgi:hypothetical protein